MDEWEWHAITIYVEDDMIKKIRIIRLILLIMIIAGCTTIYFNTIVNSIKPSSQSTIVVNNKPELSTQTPVISNLQEADQARERFRELLQNNGKCTLPCFWGLTPGESSLQSAENTLISLISISEWYKWDSTSADILLHYQKEKGNFLVSDISVNSSNGLVSEISVSISENKTNLSVEGQEYSSYVFDNLTFYEDIQFYSLAGILSSLGKPEEVLIFTYNNEKGNGLRVIGGFKILLLYPEKGVLVQFIAQMHVSENVVSGCPNTTNIKMRLFPYGHPDSFERNLINTEWEGLWPIHENRYVYWQRLEDATNLSIESFYDIFRLPTDQCIETPANLWFSSNQ